MKGFTRYFKMLLSLPGKLTHLCCALALIMAFMTGGNFAYAVGGQSKAKAPPVAPNAIDPNDKIASTLCIVVNELNGPIGKGIATIAVVSLGIGMFLGKLSWPVAVAIALGIGLIFGAEKLVDLFGGASAAGCSKT